MKPGFNISLGKSFPTATTYLGYLLLIFGLYALFSSFILALILIGLGLFLGFSVEEMQFDLENQKYRRSTRVIGINTGKWLDLNKLQYLSILKNNLTNRTQSRTLATYSSKEVAYDINLLSNSHRTKVLIQRFESLDEAKTKIQELTTILNKEIVLFDPKPSKVSRNRRNKH